MVIRGGFLSGSIKKSVGNLPGRKSACGEPPAKRMTGSLVVCYSTSQPANQPAWQAPGCNSACGYIGSVVAILFVAASLVVILLVGSLPGCANMQTHVHNSGCGRPWV